MRSTQLLAPVNAQAMALALCQKPESVAAGHLLHRRNTFPHSLSLRCDHSAHRAQAIAPVLCWKPERVAADLELSGRLLLQLDQEKGGEGNPLATPSTAAGALAV